MGNMDCGDGLLKLKTVIEPEFPDVTEKYKATVWGNGAGGLGSTTPYPLGIDDAIPRLPCLQRVILIHREGVWQACWLG